MAFPQHNSLNRKRNAYIHTLYKNEDVERKFIVIVYFVLRFGRRKRGRTVEVVRKEYQVQHNLRVGIVLVVEIRENRIVEIGSFC